MHWRGLLAGLTLLLAACAEGGPGAPPDATPATTPGAQRGGAMGPATGRWREQTHQVPVLAANGATRLIRMRLCRPEGVEAAPLVLINHGSPPNSADRAGFVPTRCESEAARWFLTRGFAVGAPLRRGYGASGGAYVEGSSCPGADYFASGQEGARDIAGALAYARALPAVDASRPAVVVGQSAGGWAALGLSGQNPEGVGAVISMAGGRGGWSNGPNTNCRPDKLASDAGRFGTTARLPTLWVYTENDSYFAPAIAHAMHRAYTGAGGLAELHQLGPWGRDGHGLFFGQNGSETWGPLAEAFLRQRSLMP